MSLIKGTRTDFKRVPYKLDKIANSRKVGLFLASTCARYMNPYVPMKSGMLSQNVTIEPFTITYNQVYAHRLYEGNSFDFSHEKHPLATAHWDKPMVAARGKEIGKEVSEYIRQRGV